MNEPTVIRILLADDNQLLRDLVSRLLNEDPRFSVCGLASDGAEAIALAASEHFDIILLDINMKTVNGFEATEAILRQNPAAKIIALSFHNSAVYVKCMLLAGAKAYLTKSAPSDEFIEAILEVHAGGKFLCSETRNSLTLQYLFDKEDE